MDIEGTLHCEESHLHDRNRWIHKQSKSTKIFGGIALLCFIVFILWIIVGSLCASLGWGWIVYPEILIGVGITVIIGIWTGMTAIYKDSNEQRGD